MSTLGHFSDYDEWLRKMADAQRYKLRKNHHKGWLGSLSPAEALDKLKEEVAELEDAITRGSEIESILEAADVANFAMAVLISCFGGGEGNVVRKRIEGIELHPQVVDRSEDQRSESGGTQLLHDGLCAYPVSSSEISEGGNIPGSEVRLVPRLGGDIHGGHSGAGKTTFGERG